MQLMILWGQRKERHEGQYAPVPLVCWSEFEVDENPGGFEKACDEARRRAGSDFEVFKLVPVSVHQPALRAALMPKVAPLQGVIIDKGS